MIDTRPGAAFWWYVPGYFAIPRRDILFHQSPPVRLSALRSPAGIRLGFEYIRP